MIRTSLLIAAVLACLPAAAQSRHDLARIDDGAGAGSSGRIAINQSAGSGNAQANLAAIALSDAGDTLAVIGATQRVAPALRDLRAARAEIAGGAFSGVSGVLSLNQAAGGGNRQLNLLAIGQGAGVDVATADDAALAGTTGDAVAGTAPVVAQADRRASIAVGALRGGQGLVQVNQTAGVGNTSTNAIVLQLPGGTP